MMRHRRTLRQRAVLRSDKAEREWGFTLIEIMISLVILSVGLLGIASQTLSVIKANSLSDQMTQAAVLVGDKMEELKRLGYPHNQLSQLKDTDGSTTDVST